MKKISILVVFSVLFLVSSFTFAQTPFKVGLNVGANVPMGEFGDVYKTGVSVEAGLYYSLPVSGLDLSLTAGYNGFKYKNDYFTGLVNTKLGVAVDGFNPEWTATDIPIMVGARYKFPAKSFYPYVSGEIGVHFMSFSDRFNGTKITGNSSNPTTLAWKNATESKSETGFGASFGAGVEIPVAPKISLDLGAKYNYNGISYSKSFEVFRNSGSTFINPELKNATFLSVRGGVVIKL